MSEREQQMHDALDMVMSSQRTIEMLERVAKLQPVLSDEIAAAVKAEKRVIETYGKELQI